MNQLAFCSIRCLVAGSVLAVTSEAQEIVARVTGGPGPGGFGHAVSGAGDLDQDGVPDYLVTSTDFVGGGIGEVLAYSGASHGLMFSLSGASSVDEFGTSIAAQALLDADGTLDFLVGAPASLSSGGPVDFAGEVVAYSGADQSVLWTAYGFHPDERFGDAIAVVGDIWMWEQDGYDEVLVGAPDCCGVGRVYLLHGATGQIVSNFVGDAVGDAFGASMVGIHDVDGDGFRDFAVGAPLADAAGVDSGLVRIFSGHVETEIATITGLAADDQFGTGIAAVEDLDGDGVDDLVIGAMGYASIVSGSSLTTLYTVEGDGRFGSSVSAAGDLDADARGDFAVGSSSPYPAPPPDGPYVDEVWFFSGADGAQLCVLGASALNWGGTPTTGFGTAIALVGDLDGNGQPETVIGAPHHDDGCNAYRAGAAMVVTATWDDSWIFASPLTDPANMNGCHGGFGWTLDGGGDVDGDGVPDLIVGTNCPEAAAYVYSGRNGALLHQIADPALGHASLGNRASRAGDVDGDGREDIAVIGDPGKVFSGATGLPVLELGTIFSVSELGDINFDGHDDVLVGIDGIPGMVRVVSGSDGSTLLEILGQHPWVDPNCPSQLDPCADPSEWFGYAISSMGDLDGDARPDILVGAPRATDSLEPFSRGGQVRVFSSGTGAQLLTVGGLFWNWTELGVAVDGAPGFDFNGDGVPDFVAGRRGIESGPCWYSTGWAYVFSGVDGSVLWSNSEQTPPGYGSPVTYGYDVACVGDANGDGLSDVLVGDPSAAGPLGPGAGRVELILGSTGAAAPLSMEAAIGSAAWDYLGYAVTSVGDLDGDGQDDIAVGASLGPGPNSVSRVRTFSGASLTNDLLQGSIRPASTPHVRTRMLGGG